MSYFSHTPDDNIVIDDLVMPLSFFQTQEGGYGLPSGYVSRWYKQGEEHILYDGEASERQGIPWADGDTYISNKATYETNYQDFLDYPDLSTAKETKLIELEKKHNEVKDAGITYNGNTFESIDGSRTVSHAHQYLDRFNRFGSLHTSFYLRDVDDNEVSVNEDDLLRITTLIDDLHYAALKNYHDHEDAIDALTTVSDVKSYDVTTGWPTTPYTDNIAASIKTKSLFMRGYISGFELENATDTEHDIKINTGVCRDQSNKKDIELETTLTKQIDVDWVVGDGNGGFPSGLTLAADTWYHVFVIATYDGTIDAGFDTSLTASNLLSDAGDYVYYRRIGSVLTNTSSNIINFLQIGDYFYWLEPLTNYTNSSPGTSSVTTSVSSPKGINCLSYIASRVYKSGSSDSIFAYFRHPNMSDIAPGSYKTACQIANEYAGTEDSGAHNTFYVKTDNDSKIAFRLSSDTGISTFEIVTLGYIDPRYYNG